MNLHRLLVSFLFVVHALASAAADDTALSGESWWARVRILADDNIEGLNTGSEGHQRAAAYVAGEFERLGLKPAGTKGYFQSVQFGVRQIKEEQSSLELVRNGQAETLSLQDDANFSLP